MSTEEHASLSLVDARTAVKRAAYAVSRERNLALVLGGGVVSQLGDWALLLALPFFVYGRTHSIVSTGGLVAAELLPRMLISPLAGVLADRWSRRLSLVGSDVFRAGLLLVLLVPAAGGPLWLVYAVALLESSAAQLFVAAEGALLPAIVPGERLMMANAALSVATSAVRLVGPPLGGVMYALLGLHASVIADSASFVLSGLLLVALRLPAPARRDDADGGGERTSFLRELVDGVRGVAGSRVFEALCLVLAAVMVTQGMLDTVLVPFVRDVLGFGAPGYGLLSAAQGLGALLGALALGAAGRHLTSGRVVGTALMLAAVFLVGFTLARPLALSAASLFLLSLPIVTASVWVQTYFQQHVPDRLLGRVLGLTETASAVGILAGVAAASVLGARLGIVAVMLAAAGVLLVSGTGALVALWAAHTREAAPDDPAAAARLTVSGEGR
jgi:predicted MFS family arabinose efflux permease